MKMIIKKAYFEESENDKARLVCDVVTENETKQLWLETDKEYKDYMTYEVADAFFVMLYPYAAFHGYDVVTESPLSETLYYNFTRYINKILSDYHEIMHKISVECDMIDFHCPSLKCAGVGFSCGVDSFCSAIRNMDEKFPNYKLTHLCTFNAGAMGVDGKSDHSFFEQKSAEIKEIADELHLKYLLVDTNYYDFYDSILWARYYNIIHSGIVLCFQKLFDNYYFGSDYTLDNFDIEKIYDDTIKDFLFSKLSNDNLKIYCDSEDLTRPQKTLLIADNLSAQNHLSVCGYGHNNCSRCEKCTRTMTTLKIIGVLDKFNNVFDVNYFEKNYNKALSRYYARRNINSYAHEIHNFYKENKGSYPLSVYFYAPFYYFTGLAKKILDPYKGKLVRLRKFYRKHLYKHM
ncbi:MAG: hypothetical protein ACI4KG_00935 [Oscillospiraceae bacterium]